jgi:hypothetical protein
MDKGTLIVIELLPKYCEVLVSISLLVLGIFQCLLCLHVMGAPMVSEVLKGLIGGDVVVCHEAILELGVILFVEGIT